MNIIVNKNISKKNYIIITLFAILLGIFLIYVATEGFIKVNILKNCKKEIAQITQINYDYELNDNKNMEVTKVIKYNYFVDNKEYTGKSSLWYKIFDKNVNVGDKIEIYYNINNPSKSKTYHISYVTILVGICFIVVPSLLLKQRIKEE